MSDELRIKFWGVRGSYPAPGEATVKYGGNTACVEIRAGERRIILDAGTGIIPLSRNWHADANLKSSCYLVIYIMTTHKAFHFLSQPICQTRGYTSSARVERLRH